MQCKEKLYCSVVSVCLHVLCTLIIREFRLRADAFCLLIICIFCFDVLLCSYQQFGKLPAVQI